MNLAKVTPFCIVTPPPSMLPLLKQTINIETLHKWVDANVPEVSTAIISSEMFLYGGLINSRVSNESTSVILSRLETLMSYGSRVKLYVSNVVMRIPGYNGDFEEPWYWADYGFDLYSFSYYTDRYDKLQQPEDLKLAESYAA